MSKEFYRPANDKVINKDMFFLSKKIDNSIC